MDLDPEVDELDTLSLFLPLPYRLAVLVVLGVWLWGLNLHCLNLLNIDVPNLIRYPIRASHTEPSHHLSVYRLASVLSIPLAVSLPIFWLLTRGSTQRILAWSLLPNAYLIFLVVLFFLPLKRLAQAGRRRFLATFRRISFGGLARLEDGKFGDVLLADALTSYAKPLSEVYVALCMFFTGQHTTNRPDRSCGGTYIVPFLIAVPFIIRLMQCITDRQPANALKYATAFPAIILSALQREPETVGLTDVALFRLWFIAAMVNSFYSFYWDVQRDWDLTLFSADCTNPDHPFGLRRTRVFGEPSLYYAIIFIDLLLRCTWSLKLSVHLEHFNDIEGGIFLLEIFEVFRRWMWAFLRIEAEWIRSKRDVPEMIPLDEYGSKSEDD